MDKEEAIKIICMIADGMDPFGENDPLENIPENNPVTIRALCMIIASLLADKDRIKLVSSYQTKKVTELVDSLNGPLKGFLKKLERSTLLNAMENEGHNKYEVAKKLQISVEELNNKIDEYGIPNEAILKYQRECIKTDYQNMINIMTLDQYLKDLEKNAILKAGRLTNFKEEQAAEKLGVTLSVLRLKLSNFFSSASFIDYPFDKTLQADYFIYPYPKGYTLDAFINNVEKELIEEALKETDYDKNRAADRLGISLESLQNRIEKHFIKAPLIFSRNK